MPWRAIAGAAVLLLASTVAAAPLTPGNVVVYRVGGGGTGGLVNSGSPVFLDEYQPDGTLVQSIPAPTAASGSNHSLIASGTATSEGLITRSADGGTLVFTGYGRALGGSGSLAATSASVVPRVIGRLRADGLVDTRIALSDYADGNNPRSAASDDGSRVWAAGGSGGVRYVEDAPVPPTTSTLVSSGSSVVNLRQLLVAAGRLYVTTASMTEFRVGTVGGGLPTAPGASIATLPGIATSGTSPYAIFLADLDPMVPGPDTLYVADDGLAGLSKFRLLGGSWVARGSIGGDADDYLGLAGVVDGGDVVLYATRLGGGGASGGGQLVRLVDGGGPDGTLGGTPVVLATAATNTAFRGVAMAPQPPPLGPVMRITEFMYNGTGGEFVEFTNVGDQPAELAGWSYDDDSRIPYTFDLSAFGVVQPGESVIMTESGAAAFRATWGLCAGVKVIGNSEPGLGNGDEINLFDAQGNLVDRLTYPKGGPPFTNNRSAWVPAGALGANDAAAWVLSTVGDAEGSVQSAGSAPATGSPGRSQRAIVAYDPCVGIPGTPTVTVDPVGTSPYLELAVNGSGAASGVIGDPTDPAAGTGIAFVFDDDGPVGALTITASSSNPGVVPASGLALTGSGANRLLRIVPSAPGLAAITVRAVDADGRIGTYVIAYAASAAAAAPAVTRFHTGASDASTAIEIDAQHMLVADDENQFLRLYRRELSGLHLGSTNLTPFLALTDLSGGMPREVDIEASTRVGDRVYWAGSHGNQATGSFAARPNRRRVFATDLGGSGPATVPAYAGRYDFLAQDLIAWDQANGHGLGANALGFAAGAAPGVSPEVPGGFNIEGLTMAPDGQTAYLAFRAPLPALPQRTRALIVPVRDFDALVTGAAPGSRPAGSAQFDPPILLDLGGRAIRSIERNRRGQYVIVAGPVQSGLGATTDFRLYGWDGNPDSAPFEVAADLAALAVDGAFEGIVAVPDPLGPGTELTLVVDNGDSVYYGNGVAAKDLAERRHAKYRSVRVLVDFPPLPDLVFGDGFESPPAP